MYELRALIITRLEVLTTLPELSAITNGELFEGPDMLLTI